MEQFELKILTQSIAIVQYIMIYNPMYAFP